MDPISPKEYIDVKCDALKAESRADLAEIKALIETKLDHMPTSREFWGGLVGSVVAIVTLILGIMSYTGGRVDASANFGAAIQRIQSSTDQNTAAIKDLHDQNEKLRQPAKIIRHQ